MQAAIKLTARQVVRDYLRTRSPEDLNRLVKAHVGLVRNIAASVRIENVETIDRDDLVQVGLMAIVDCAERFDERPGVEFATFATRRVRGEMLDEVRRQDCLPRSVRARINAVAKVIDDAKANGESIGRAEAIRRLDVPKALRANWLRDSRPVSDMSLSRHVITGKASARKSLTILETLTAKSEHRDEPDAMDDAMRLLRGLQPLEKKAMLAYCLEGITMREIGERLGYSESFISLTIDKAKKFLRAKLAAV